MYGDYKGHIEHKGYTEHKVYTEHKCHCTGHTGNLEKKKHKEQKEQRDIFYPDNPNREERLKNLSAQMDEQCRLIIETSELIDVLGQEISDALYNFQELFEKVLLLIPVDQTILVQKLKSLLEKLIDLNKSVQINVITGSAGFLIPKYIAQIISSAAITYGFKAIRNAYVKKIMIKQGADFTDKIVRKAFIQKMPRWFKWGVNSVTGFLSGTLFSIGLEFAFGAIFGKIEKEQLQDLLKESLDCRYYSTRAKLINQISEKCFIEVKGKISGGQSALRMINTLIQTGEPQLIKYAYQQLAKLGIEELLDQAIADVKEVNHELIIKTINSIDSGAWKDDFQATWQPTSEDQFFDKYPPE